MRSAIRGMIAALISLPVIACAHGGDVTSTELSARALAPRSNAGMSFITGLELRSRSTTRNLLEAVSNLRPGFLRHRGLRPTVVIDGVTRGSVETLGEVPVDAVERIQLLSGPEATMRYGTLHSGAILLVTTRRR